MELISGGDLLDFIIKDNADGVPEEIAKHISYQMCDALAVSLSLASASVSSEFFLVLSFDADSPSRFETRSKGFWSFSIIASAQLVLQEYTSDAGQALATG